MRRPVRRSRCLGHTWAPPGARRRHLRRPGRASGDVRALALPLPVAQRAALRDHCPVREPVALRPWSARHCPTMSAAAVTLFGALGAVAALLAVLLPVILTQGASLRRELDAVRADVGEVRADVGEVRRDLHDVSDRVARIEGALTGRVGAVAGVAAALTPAPPVAAG